MNELLIAWVMWVNGNYDVLIMTITLLVVGGLVLEVIRLNKRIGNVDSQAWEAMDEFYEFEEISERKFDDQINVNVHLAEDIAELQKRLKEVTTKRKAVRK